MLVIIASLSVLILFITFVFIKVRKMYAIEKYQNLYHKVYNEAFDYLMSNNDLNSLDELTTFDKSFPFYITNNNYKKVKSHYINLCDKFGEYSETYKRNKRTEKIDNML